MPWTHYRLGPDGPGGRSLETAVVAVLPPGVNPTNLEINVELRETASWSEDATLVLARRRAEVLNAFLSLRPEQAEKGSEIGGVVQKPAWVTCAPASGAEGLTREAADREIVRIKGRFGSGIIAGIPAAMSDTAICDR